MERHPSGLKVCRGRLEGMWRWLCFIAPEDDFIQLVRKMAVTFLLFSTPVALAWGSWLCHVGFFSGAKQVGQDPNEEHDPLGAKLGMVLLFILTLVNSVPYFICRRKGHITTKMLNAHAATIVLWWACSFFTVPELGIREIAVAQAIFAIVARSSLAVPLGLVELTICVCSAYNDAYLDNTSASGAYSTLLMVPGARIRSPAAEQLLGTLAGLFCIVCAVGCVHAVVSEFATELRKAKIAVKITHDIVELLRQYDTEGVARALDDADDMDPALVKSLKAMNGNLENYRPHLPNYLFMEATEIDENGDEIVVSTSMSSYSQSAAQSQTIPRIAFEGSLEELSDIESEASHSMEKGSQTGSLQPNGSRSPQPMPLKRAQSVAERTHLSYSRYVGRIAYALIDLNPEPQPELTPVNWRQRLVDNIYTSAQMSKASIHSLVGGIAVVTWNATHRVAQPEVKAVNFSSAIRQLFPKVSIAIFAGDADCESLATSTKQQTLLISTSWIHALWNMFHVARAYNTCVINSTLFDESKFAANAIPVDILHYQRSFSEGFPPPPAVACNGSRLVVGDVKRLSDSPPPTADTSKTFIYELIGEIKREDDEWLYQIGQEDKRDLPDSESSLLRKALQAVDEGDFETAQQSLRAANASIEGTPLTSNGGGDIGQNKASALRTRLAQFVDSRIAQR